MTAVAILPVPTGEGETEYRAVLGRRQFVGKTVGEALDGLTRQMTDEASATLVVVLSAHPDRYFSAEQRARLQELMDRWRVARNQGEALSPDELQELDELAETEVRASRERAAAMVRDLGA